MYVESDTLDEKALRLRIKSILKEEKKTEDIQETIDDLDDSIRKLYALVAHFQMIRDRLEESK